MFWYIPKIYTVCILVFSNLPLSVISFHFFSKVVIKILWANAVPEVICWFIVSVAKEITGTVYACLVESDRLNIIYAVNLNKIAQLLVLLRIDTSTLISDNL